MNNAERALKIAETILVAAATVLLAVLTSAISEVKDSVLDELTDLRRVTLSIGGTAAEIRKSAKVAAEASVEQKAYFDGISKRAQTVLENSSAATASLDTFIRKTDHQVTDLLFPQLTATLKANDERMAQLMADTDTTVKGLAQSSTEATEAMASAAKILGDPSIPETLKHTDATSANIEAATGHLNETTALIEGKVKKMTAPASLAKQAAEAVAHYATLFWGAFLGAK